MSRKYIVNGTQHDELIDALREADKGDEIGSAFYEDGELVEEYSPVSYEDAWDRLVQDARFDREQEFSTWLPDSVQGYRGDRSLSELLAKAYLTELKRMVDFFERAIKGKTDAEIWEYRKPWDGLGQ